MDFNDRRAWDDSELIDSWNAALEEYKKYHSIHAEGQRLEDVLSKEELEQIHAQRQELEVKRKLAPANEQNRLTSPKSMPKEQASPERELPLHVPDLSSEHDHHGQLQTEDRDVDHLKKSALLVQTDPNGKVASAHSMPPLPPFAARDEAMKNMLVSWYYAGYYAGLFEGQRYATNAEDVK